MQTIVRRVNDESRAHGIDEEIKKLQKEYSEVSNQPAKSDDFFLEKKSVCGKTINGYLESAIKMENGYTIMVMDMA